MGIAGKLGFVKTRTSSISTVDEETAKKEQELQTELQKAISETSTTQAQTATSATEATTATQAAAESQQQATTSALDTTVLISLLTATGRAVIAAAKSGSSIASLTSTSVKNMLKIALGSNISMYIFSSSFQVATSHGNAGE